MSKIVRLTENDLTKIVKRVIKEQEQQEVVHNIVNSPKLKTFVDQALSNLSARELISLKKNLTNVGIDKTPSLSDAINAGNILLQNTEKDVEISEEDEEDEKLTFIDRVRMGMSTLGLANTALAGSLGTSLIEKITTYANIDTTSSDEELISLVIGIILMLIGNTVYDKLKRIHKD